MKWNNNIAFGEMIGSIVLTLGIMLLTVAVKRKSFGLTSKWQSKMFTVLGVFTLVVIGITTARGFGAPGAINPGIALMIGIFENSSKAWNNIWILSISADFVGGIVAALLFLIMVKSFNSYSKHEEKIMLSKIFVLNNQHPVKNVSMEFTANFFWYLPVVAMIKLQLTKGNDHVGAFLVPIVAGFAISATLLVTNDIGVANLNPQIWLGEFIVKLVSKRFIISKQELASELSSLLSVFAMGAMWGSVALGFKK